MRALLCTAALVVRVLRAREKPAAMRTELAAAFLVAALMGATAACAQDELSATEIFNLREMCRIKGEKLVNQSKIGNPQLLWYSETNYSVNERRCYVDIITRYVTNDNILFLLHSFYDGNSERYLAYTNYKNGVLVGGITDSTYSKNDKDELESAKKYILDRMKER
jgi:hypothetical protein